MVNRLELDWLQGRASLAAAAGWTAEEMRLITDLGYALAEQGHTTEALAIFEGLAALAPATGYFQSALGALRLRTGEPQLAIAHLDRALAADPHDVNTLINRGEARLQVGDARMAHADLVQAIKLTTANENNVNYKAAGMRARALVYRLRQTRGAPSDDGVSPPQSSLIT